MTVEQRSTYRESFVNRSLEKLPLIGRKRKENREFSDLLGDVFSRTISNIRSYGFSAEFIGDPIEVVAVKEEDKIIDVLLTEGRELTFMERVTGKEGKEITSFIFDENGNFSYLRLGKDLSHQEAIEFLKGILESSVDQEATEKNFALLSKMCKTVWISEASGLHPVGGGDTK